MCTTCYIAMIIALVFNEKIQSATWCVDRDGINLIHLTRSAFRRPGRRPCKSDWFGNCYLAAMYGNLAGELSHVLYGKFGQMAKTSCFAGFLRGTFQFVLFRIKPIFRGLSA